MDIQQKHGIEKKNVKRMIKHFYFPKNSIINNNSNSLTNKLFCLCQIVNIMNNNFSPFSPNDAKDFLIFFIGKLHEELNVKIDTTFNIINPNDPLSNFISYFTRNYNSIISNVFNWTNQTKRKCSNCSSQIFSYQTFPYLILDLEKTRKKNFINDLDDFHKSKLGNDICPIVFIDLGECDDLNAFNFSLMSVDEDRKIKFSEEKVYYSLCDICFGHIQGLFDRVFLHFNE